MPRYSMAGLHLCGTRPRAPLWGFGHHAWWRPAASSHRSLRSGDAGGPDVTAALDLQEHAATGSGVEETWAPNEPAEGRADAARTGLQPAGAAQGKGGRAASGSQRAG